MGNVFGDKKTVKQIIREQKRINNRSIRDLDRELNRIKREEKKAENEMKRLAKQGQMAAVKHLAKDIVRMRDTQTKFIKLKSDLRSLSIAMDSMAATQQLQTAMKNVARTMAMVSHQVKLPELQAALQKYQMEAEKMEMKQEMISDAMDDALEHDSDDEEELVQQVMDSIGLDLNEKLVDAPKKDKEEEVEDPMNTDLQARLNNLKR